MTVISFKLLELIKERYRLNLQGTHGLVHWGKVWENGMKLSEQEGVVQSVVELFAIFHDSQRFSEHDDKLHGLRASELLHDLREYIPLNDDDFELLSKACRLHTHAKTDDNNITIQCCYDADRLDLGRVGIKPIAELLCSPMAKDQDFIEEAYIRSLIPMMPDDAFGLDRNKVDELYWT